MILSRKVLSGLAGTLVMALVSYVLGRFGLEVSPELGTALAGLVGAVVAYFVPESEDAVNVMDLVKSKIPDKPIADAVTEVFAAVVEDAGNAHANVR